MIYTKSYTITMGFTILVVLFGSLNERSIKYDAKLFGENDFSTIIDSSDAQILMSLYESTRGKSWCSTKSGISPWDLTIALDDWHGCETIDIHNLICLDMGFCTGESQCEKLQVPVCKDGGGGGNNLQGHLPNILCLPDLLQLKISNNPNLTGSIPDFSCSKNLYCLKLSKNKLTGSIPCSIANLKNLEDFRIEENELDRAIPLCIIDSLIFLEEFVAQDNNLSGLIPDFGSLPSVKTLNLHKNSFTFEDILPNYISNSTIDEFNISGQDSILRDTTIYAAIGYPLSIDLEIDHQLTSNNYDWHKNNNSFQSTKFNKLEFTSIKSTDAGLYNCTITNDSIPAEELTLYSYDIIITPIIPRNIDHNIPDVITPNGDGYNDTFIIPGILDQLEEYAKNTLTIYNHWGDKIYQQSNYQNDWNGEGVPESIVFYTLELDQGGIFRGQIAIIK